MTGMNEVEDKKCKTMEGRNIGRNVDRQKGRKGTFHCPLKESVNEGGENERKKKEE